jgi:RNA polymerase sigma factor (sigma-70 family)
VLLVRAERRKAGRETPPDAAAEPAAQENPDAALWIRKALGELEKDDREILMLREYEQLSYAEIGALLLLPLNTVRSRLFRARLALKEKLLPARDNV